MRSYSLIVLLITGMLTACGTTSGAKLVADGKNALDSASLCCKTLADAAVLSLPAEKQHIRIDATRQAFLFDGVKSFFVLYRLPDFRSTYSILVSSSPEGTATDLSIFMPSISTYDESFRLVRHFGESTLRSRGSTMERTVFINPANANERYLSIHSANLSAPVDRILSIQTATTVPVGTGFFMLQDGKDMESTLRPAPVGAVDVEVSGLMPAGR